MIQIEAKFMRNHSPIFLNGELVECFITFTNRAETNDAPSTENFTTLAWGTVQLSGYCQTKQLPKNLIQLAATSKTSLASNDHSFFSTDLNILFCDLKIGAGESKSYFIRERIPKSVAPTYRGINVKYYYKLNIATQKVGGKVQMLQIPLRVLPLCINENLILSESNQSSAQLTPVNPFLDETRMLPLSRIALENLQNITATRKPNNYLLKNARGIIGRFCVYRNGFKLGDEIVGTFDFSCGTVPCIQYICTLQSEETLKPENSDTEKSKKAHPKNKITKYSHVGDVCVGLKTTGLSLPIPFHITPSFQTNLMELSWKIEFQIMTSVLQKQDLENWKHPKKDEIESTIWDLPVKIFSTSPTQMHHNDPAMKIYFK